ncbi:MAG: hypothetical protein ACI90V_004756, partial [Bacillariaceae sp.]
MCQEWIHQLIYQCYCKVTTFTYNMICRSLQEVNTKLHTGAVRTGGVDPDPPT